MHEKADRSTSLLADLKAILGEPIVQDIPAGVACLLSDGRADDVLRLAHEKLHTFPFKDVPLAWRRAYEEAAVAKAANILSKTLSERTQSYDDFLEEAWIDEAVHSLDMAVIMTGAPLRDLHIKRFYTCLSGYLERFEGCHRGQNCNGRFEGEERQSKRRRKDTDAIQANGIPDAWPAEDVRRPELRHPVLKSDSPSVSHFQQHLDATNTEHGPLPLHITNSIAHWPALEDRSGDRSWSNPQYILRRTAGGRRLVPIEIGRSYTDDDWTQKVMTVGAFVKEHMLHNDTADSGKSRAYLAQYDVFAQIPDLRNDIAIPDYCCTTPPRSGRDEDDADGLEPQLNAWFGPAGTVSPAHTDPHHNILAQVVGYKYIRLFAPSETANMYPRGTGEDGVDMHNTSQVDVGRAMKVLEGWDWQDDLDNDLTREEAGLADQYPDFKKAAYQEVILGPGDCIYIPRGWWHYVRSLSTSFSVSFWWD